MPECSANVLEQADPVSGVITTRLYCDVHGYLATCDTDPYVQLISRLGHRLNLLNAYFTSKWEEHEQVVAASDAELYPDLTQLPVHLL